MASRKRLTADDWATAALDALRTGGLAAVAVEPIAARLGTTKGSFYWHFPDRESLVRAALALWEQEETDRVIATLGAMDQPSERLRFLLEGVLTQDTESDLIVTLAADAHHPAVRETLERVTRRRVDYVAEQMRAAGLGAREARRRATVAYAAYVGWWHLRLVAPDAAPRGKAARPYADVLRRVIDL